MNQNLSFKLTPIVDNIPNPLFSGDFDGDGIIDTAIIQRNSQKVFITLGNGEEKEVTTQGQPIRILIDDFDGDNLDDILIQNSISFNSQEISLILGNASGQFQTPVTVASDSNLDFTIVDIDDNELPDLLTIKDEGNQNTIQILQNQGNNNFIQKNELITTNAFNPGLVIVEDLDNDGIKDLVIPNQFENSVRIFIGQENSDFQEDKSYAVGNNVSQVIVEDFNSDGNQDIITVNDNSSISILLNDGNGNFIASESREKPESSEVTFYSDRLLGDFNGDGFEDLPGIVAGQYYYEPYQLFIAFGQADRSFAEPFDTEFILPGGAYRGGIVQAGDFNGDGFDDLVLNRIIFDDYGSPYSSFNSLLISEGNGTFTENTSFFEGNNIPPFPNKLEDIDNDGIDDWLRLDNNSNALSVTIAKGNLQFEDTVEYNINHNLDTLEVTDFNNDGLNDVAVIDLENGQISILFNQGNGDFDNSLTYDVAPNSSLVTVEDLTGDNIPDIILNNNLTISVIQGQANNSLQNTVTTTIDAFISNNSIAIEDFNSDGLKDILGYSNRGIAVILNLGDGKFKEPIHSVLGYRPNSIVIEDFNNDNILDIQADNAILLGQGDGSFFTTPIITFSSSFSSVVVEDFDNDNILDFVALGEQTASLITGKGDGSFNNSINFETRIFGDYIATDDVNNDNRIDVIIGNDSSSETALLINDPETGFIAQPKVNIFPSRTINGDFNFSDFNNDGVVDFVGVNSSYQEMGIAISQDNGSYQTTVKQISEGYSSQFMELGDFNGDRITDIVAISSTNNQNEISVLLGQGDGEFNSSITSQVTAQITDIVTGDFNGDGITDLAISNGKSNNSIPGEVLILEGQTDGSFKNPIKYEVGISPQDIIAADFDGDGIQDLATANNRGGDVSLLLGKADGTFGNVQNVAVANPPGGISFLDRSSLKAGDFNGDGIADLAVEVRNPDNRFINKGINILLGDGNGNFQQVVSENSPNLLEVADFNNDGLSDVILSDNDINFSVLLSTGNGNFATALEFKAGNFNNSEKVSPLKAGDFNQDGIQDLAVKSFGDISLVINNTPNNLLGNTPPAVINDNATTDKNTIATGNVLDNDSDFNGDRLTVTEINSNANNIGQEITLASGVLLTLNSNGSFSYNPNSQFDNLFVNEQATDSFTYTVTDSKGITDTATVTITIQGIEDPDLITGTEGDDILIGNAQDNIIRGLGRRDSLEGEDGADTLDGGVGNDTLIGGNGDDSLEGGGGNDILEGNAGNDILTDLDGNDWLQGGLGDDSLEGGWGNDKLEGGAGKDILEGGAGNDWLEGGLGDDFLSSGSSEDWLRGDSGNDTLDGGQGRDRLDGGLGNDILIGGTEGDSFVLRQGDGTDLIVDFLADLSRGKSDRFFLSYGLQVTDFDLVRSGNHTEIQFAATNEIVAIVENVLPEEISEGHFIEEFRFLHGTTSDDTLNGGAGYDRISAGSGDDIVRGNGGDDYIHAHLGNDSVLGGTGNDTLIGGEGKDILKGQAGNDSLEGDEGNDSLFGNNGNDTINGGDGNDQLRGDLGKDSLIGDAGNDTLLGFNGDDTLQGKADDDFLDGGTGADRLFGDNGDDFLRGSLGNDTLRGDRGEDTLVGGSGNDNLVGGADNDVLQGQSNDDFLDGADGLDTLIGGEGRDRFFLRVGAGTDTIVDFEQNLDKFVLGHNLNFEQLSLVTNGNDTEIQVIATEEVIAIISDTSPNNLDINDFV